MNDPHYPISGDQYPIPEPGVITSTDWGWCYENPREAAARQEARRWLVR